MGLFDWTAYQLYDSTKTGKDSQVGLIEETAGTRKN